MSVPRALAHCKELLLQNHGYPDDMMLVHSLDSICSWRAEHGTDDGTFASKLYHLTVSYFAQGYGGSTFRDYLMGVSPGLFTSGTVARGWVAAFVAVYMAPGDTVYKVIRQPGPVNTLVTVYQSIDSSTGIINSVNKAADLFPSNSVAPLMAALAYGVGGAGFNMLLRAQRGIATTAEHYEAIRLKARVTMTYVAVYYLTRRVRGHNHAQITVALIDVIWKLYELSTGRKFDPHKYLTGNNS